MLEQEGKRIHILELEGVLFFGTADKVTCRVEQLFAEDVDYIILDFQRLFEIDGTGASIIRQLIRKCASRQVSLFLSWNNTSAGAKAFDELRYILTDEELNEAYCDGLDNALARAEDRLLDKLLQENRYEEMRSIGDQDALSTLTAEEFALIHDSFDKCSFNDGEAVFQQGDSGDCVYFIASGQANIIHRAGNGDAQTLTRLATICPGTCFGEMAILDSKPRSTNVTAKGKLACFRLCNAELQKMMREHPSIAFKILAGLGRDLATRVRVANKRNELQKT